jgi:hypothetical protein
MRGYQGVVAGQADAIVSRRARKPDQFIRNCPSDAAIAVSRSDEHADHFTFSIIEALYRAGADDPAFAHRAQKESPIAVDGLCAVDIRQTRIDEIPYERIRVLMKMLMPNGFHEPSSSRRVAGKERPDLPIGCEARDVRHRHPDPWAVLLS